MLRLLVSYYVLVVIDFFCYFGSFVYCGDFFVCDGGIVGILNVIIREVLIILYMEN